MTFSRLAALLSLLFTLCTSAVSLAVIDPAISTKPVMKEGYKELDLSQLKGIAPLPDANSNVKFNTSCRTKMGIESQPGEANYQSCLAEAQRDKAAGNNNGANQKFEFTTGN